MKIGFLPTHLSERGTTTAVYDYAFHNERILGNKSIIFYQKNHPENFKEYEEKFNKEFQCVIYEKFSEIEDFVEKEKIDAMYIIKYGLNDEVIIQNKKCKNLIHSVFVSQPHGQKYAFVSKYLSDKNGGHIPFVPHMIDLPTHIKENLRNEYNIPKNAIVFGGMGGKTSFDIDFVHKCIDIIIEEIPSIYFLFMNFNRNTKEHPRIIYLQPTINKESKVKFINTCDAMIHGRSIGETFGLAIGEFSTCNKPVITYLNSDPKHDKEHIRILGEKGIYYENQKDLLNIFRNFNIEEKDWNCYKEYEPSKVMNIFKNVFLSDIIYNIVEINGRKYRYYNEYDSMGNDIFYHGNLSLDELEKIAYEKNYPMFNTLGFFKNKIDVLCKSPWFSKNDGIYIKEDLNKEDLNKEDLNREDLNREDLNKEEILNIFLITSVINISKNPLNYHKTRSVFNTEERFIQTLNTIMSIKIRDPKAKIYLLEASKIEEKHSILLKNFVTDIFNIPDNILNIIDGPNKSLAESILVQIGLEKIKEKETCENYRIFKISGRYYLNDKFNFDNFSKELYTFQNKEDFINTFLYSIPKKQIENFLHVLKKTENNLKNYERYTDIEHEIKKNIPEDKILLIYKLGISGRISPTGDFISV